MVTTRTRDRLIGDSDANPDAAEGSIELEVREPKTKSKPMDAAEQATHGVAANLGRFAYLLVVSFLILLTATGAWFYFHR
jgi:hypothetical protein